jgi:hypothetical protein
MTQRENEYQNQQTQEKTNVKDAKSHKGGRRMMMKLREPNDQKITDHKKIKKKESYRKQATQSHHLKNYL